MGGAARRREGDAMRIRTISQAGPDAASHRQRPPGGGVSRPHAFPRRGTTSTDLRGLAHTSSVDGGALSAALRSTITGCVRPGQNKTSPLGPPGRGRTALRGRTPVPLDSAAVLRLLVVAEAVANTSESKLNAGSGLRQCRQVKLRSRSGSSRRCDQRATLRRTGSGSE